MSTKREFDLYSERYAQMQVVLTEAQRAVHVGEWSWIGGDRVPNTGGDGIVPLRGASPVNSYFLQSDRLWSPPGATGASRDLQPMIDYFGKQDWSYRKRTIGRYHEVLADTGTGWYVEYEVQPSGDYGLTVYSGQYWTNDSLALTEAVGGRNDGEYPEESLPGEYPPFPKWSDPTIRPPKI
ncbi:hypothetical protein [Curtobacterium sp. MCSS17_007]|uniref:hypothetical protein n=1 Tax=Curtobacterium sp. MCSS17_007 TaxID=2175646 RepID=UPI000DAA4F2D|nr:hypothetical protein [Curtobacterium sp. MCSS17_007]WIE75143.1 hypothetical protein DEJ22_012910 [Curtobacterium sp. MCSS17_007]